MQHLMLNHIGVLRECLLAAWTFIWFQSLIEQTNKRNRKKNKKKKRNGQKF